MTKIISKIRHQEGYMNKNNMFSIYPRWILSMSCDVSMFFLKVNEWYFLITRENLISINSSHQHQGQYQQQQQDLPISLRTVQFPFTLPPQQQQRPENRALIQVNIAPTNQMINICAGSFKQPQRQHSPQQQLPPQLSPLIMPLSYQQQ